MINKQVFITKSNLKSIISSLEEIGQTNSTDQTAIYKWPIYFLHKNEINRLAKQKEFLKDPENVVRVYKKKSGIDNNKYIYEGKNPSYHTKTNCKNLNSKFSNYEIPEEIREKGKEEIQRFRKWFKENLGLMNVKPDLFVAKMQIAFGLKYIPQPVNYDNTGITEFDNLNLNQLEERINLILREASVFYNDNPEKQTIIKRFSKLTFLADRKEKILNNDTKLSDEELKSFLKEYDQSFKKPVKELLLQYFMVKYNPELKFDGWLLDQLNFKMCNNCIELEKST